VADLKKLGIGFCENDARIIHLIHINYLM